MARNKKKAAQKLVKGVKNLVASEVKKLKPGTLARAGRKLGSLVGQPGVGAGAGRALAALIGHGDYRVLKNSLMDSSMPKQGVVFDKRGRRGVRVMEREFITNITASQTFSLLSYAIQPGLGGSFPWLSALSVNFDEWVPNGIVYEFRSTSADWNGSTQALGTVILAADYDSLDADYSSKVEMECAEGAISVRASEGALCGIECAPSQRQNVTYYTRTGSVPAGGTISAYDLGKFQIATTGFANDTDVIGELWVSYDITFFKKQLSGGQIGFNINSCVLTGTGSFSGSNPFGDTNVQYGTMKLTRVDANTLAFPSYISTGLYGILFEWDGTGNSPITQPPVILTSAGATPIYSGGGNTFVTNTGNTSTKMIFGIGVKITGPGATFTVSSPNLPTGVNLVTVTVFQLPGTGSMGPLA